MKSIKNLLFLFCVLISVQSVAQFSLHGELRPRSEYRHGFQSLIGPEEDAAFFVSQRSRLNFGYSQPEVTVYVSLQDVRVWGEVPQLNRTDFNSSVHEAWAQFPIVENLSLKLGRQELMLDNTRIFGNVDWAQQGRSHDLALLQWSHATGFSIKGALAYNQERENRSGTLYTLNNYKTMQMAWFNYKMENTNLSFLLMNLGFQGNDNTLNNRTFGPFVAQNIGNSRLEGALYLQTGRTPQDQDLGAWYAGLEVITPLTENWTARAGFELLSGTDVDESEKNKSFNPWFGTNHRFNGHMDYFYVGNHLNSVGLRDLFFGANYAGGSWSLMAALHTFWADAKITDAAGESMSAYLGNEIDLMLGYAVNSAVAFRLGYSHLLPTATMERIKGGSKDEIQNWLWAMIVIKPRFI